MALAQNETDKLGGKKMNGRLCKNSAQSARYLDTNYHTLATFSEIMAVSQEEDVEDR